MGNCYSTDHIANDRIHTDIMGGGGGGGGGGGEYNGQLLFNRPYC